MGWVSLIIQWRDFQCVAYSLPAWLFSFGESSFPFFLLFSCGNQLLWSPSGDLDLLDAPIFLLLSHFLIYLRLWYPFLKNESPAWKTPRYLTWSVCWLSKNRRISYVVRCSYLFHPDFKVCSSTFHPISKILLSWARLQKTLFPSDEDERRQIARQESSLANAFVNIVWWLEYIFTPFIWLEYQVQAF